MKLNSVKSKTASPRFVSFCLILLMVGACLFAGIQLTKSLSAQETGFVAELAKQESNQEEQKPEDSDISGTPEEMRYLQDEVAYLAIHHSGVVDTQQEGRAMLGVHVRKADETLRKQLKVKGSFGLVVEHVTVESAEFNNLENHDFLYRFDDQLLVNEEQLKALVDSKSPGDKVAIEFFRNGELQETKIELTQHKVSSLRATLKDIESYHKPFLENFSHSEAVKLLNCKDCHQAPTDASSVEDLWTYEVPELIRSELKLNAARLKAAEENKIEK